MKSTIAATGRWASVLLLVFVAYGLQATDKRAGAQSLDPDCYHANGLPKDPAPAKCCIREATLGLMQVRTFAMTCGARAADLDAVDSGASPIARAPSCHRPLSVNSQLDAFNECSRMYACAKLSMACVSERAKREGICRPQFANDCLARHPIPGG